ncbi:MAG: DUF3180 domain-containing protein [Propionicimonas sp.]|nr:DUF3180 domain-containing protein [Propionicimonas sp.]
MAEPAPTVRLTSWRTIALSALVGAVVGWGVFFALDRLSLALPIPPLAGAGAIAVIAAVVGWQARQTRRAIHRRHERVQPNLAVALLALGKTAVIAGAALAGTYAAIVLYSLPHLDAESPRARVVGAGVSLLACVGLAVAGRMLERACEIPNPPPEDQSATPGEDPGEPRTRG